MALFKDILKKPTVPENNPLSEYERLKKEYKDLESEEKGLRDYLNVNVFNYAQDSQLSDDVFSVANSSMAFLDRDKNSHRINPNIPVVEINNLTKYYASRKEPSIVNSTIKVYLGDVHIVVGPSGSGKTTIFNCLRGIEDYEGEILIDGKEIQSNPDFSYDDIVGFVAYDFNWDAYATVEEVIRDRFQELNLVEAEVQGYIRSALDQLNISYLRHYHIIDLNLLEKRKIQIAIALINDPNVIVFDEIFLGLQNHEVINLLEIFSQLKREDRALILFMHSCDKFRKFANSITVLSQGKVYYTGDIDKLFLKRVGKYSVITSDNSKALEILSGVKCNFKYNEISDCIFVSFDGDLSLLNFQKECSENGIIIHEIIQLEVSLEDLYPVLSHRGNGLAIRDINSWQFFTPD